MLGGGRGTRGRSRPLATRATQTETRTDRDTALECGSAGLPRGLEGLRAGQFVCRYFFVLEIRVYPSGSSLKLTNRFIVMTGRRCRPARSLHTCAVSPVTVPRAHPPWSLLARLRTATRAGRARPRPARPGHPAQCAPTDKEIHPQTEIDSRTGNVRRVPGKASATHPRTALSLHSFTLPPRSPAPPPRSSSAAPGSTGPLRGLGSRGGPRPR